jgi:uncharacterized membrane protein required for colicin V production
MTNSNIVAIIGSLENQSKFLDEMSFKIDNKYYSATLVPKLSTFTEYNANQPCTALIFLFDSVIICLSRILIPLKKSVKILIWIRLILN